MYRRKRNKREQGDVEMNLAAMLDMAFQLLTFFILTFKPAPTEGQLAVNLPPPRPIVAPDPHPEVGGAQNELAPPAGEPLHLMVSAGSDGDVRDISIENSAIIRGPLSLGSLQAIDQKLQSIFGLQAAGYDRVQIVVDGQLRYGELMKIVDVCSRQIRADGEQMNKISFTEL